MILQYNECMSSSLPPEKAAKQSRTCQYFAYGRNQTLSRTLSETHCYFLTSLITTFTPILQQLSFPAYGIIGSSSQQVSHVNGKCLTLSNYWLYQICGLVGRLMEEENTNKKYIENERMGGTPVQYMRQANYWESSEIENIKKNSLRLAQR